MSWLKLLLAFLLFKFIFLGVFGLPLYKFWRGEFDAQNTIDFIKTNLVFLFVVLVFLGVIYFLYAKPARPPNRQD